MLSASIRWGLTKLRGGGGIRFKAIASSDFLGHWKTNSMCHKPARIALFSEALTVTVKFYNLVHFVVISEL